MHFWRKRDFIESVRLSAFALILFFEVRESSNQLATFFEKINVVDFANHLQDKFGLIFMVLQQ